MSREKAASGSVSVDRADRFQIREFYDDRWHVVAELRLRKGYAPQIFIPQCGHSSTDEDGGFTTYISADVLIALGEAAKERTR